MCDNCAALTAEIERLKEDIELLELYRKCLFDMDKIWRENANQQRDVAPGGVSGDGEG
jgi:hypothetical protein